MPCRSAPLRMSPLSTSPLHSMPGGAPACRRVSASLVRRAGPAGAAAPCSPPPPLPLAVHDSSEESRVGAGADTAATPCATTAMDNSTSFRGSQARSAGTSTCRDQGSPESCLLCVQYPTVEFYDICMRSC